MHSAHDLIEAAVETTDEAVVSGCRKFVRSWSGEEITLQYAKGMIPLYVPPKWGTGGKPTARHSPLWIVSLTIGSKLWDSEACRPPWRGWPRR